MRTQKELKRQISFCREMLKDKNLPPKVRDYYLRYKIEAEGLMDEATIEAMAQEVVFG